MHAFLARGIYRLTRSLFLCRSHSAPQEGRPTNDVESLSPKSLQGLDSSAAHAYTVGEPHPLNLVVMYQCFVTEGVFVLEGRAIGTEEPGCENMLPL